MKFKLLIFFGFFTLLSSCVGTASKGFFGTGVSVAFDPRSVGTQIDDSIMQKNVAARILLRDSTYLLSINTKVFATNTNLLRIEDSHGVLGFH